MPNRNGRWESWETRLAREKAEAPTEEESSTTVPTKDQPKAKRARRTNKAAADAIAEATGVAVSLDPEPITPPVEDDGQEDE